MTNKKFKLAAMSLALTACVAASPLAANAETGPENATATNETKLQEIADESNQDNHDESKQDNNESKQDNDESKQDNDESKQDDDESKQDDDESKQDDDESKQDDDESKQDNDESKQDDNESKQDNDESKQDNDESKQDNNESKQDNDESKQDNHDESNQDNNESKQDNDESKQKADVENNDPAAPAQLMTASRAAVPSTSTGVPATPTEDDTVATITRQDGTTTTTTKYTSFDDAVNAAENNDIIEVVKDATSTGIDLRDKKLTIKGKTVTTKTDSGTEEKTTVKPQLKFVAKEGQSQIVGITLWGSNLTFQDMDVNMTGASSTTYNKWNAVCMSNNASLTLNRTKLSMDGTDLDASAQGIYMAGRGRNELNVDDHSTLTINNYYNAIAWDGVKKDNKGSTYFINITDGSTFQAKGNGAGIVGKESLDVLVDNSTLTITDCTERSGINGADVKIVNGSTANISDNHEGYGIHANDLLVEKSTLTANNNGYGGIRITGKGEFTNSTVTVTGTENKGNASVEIACGVANETGKKPLNGSLSVQNSTLNVSDNNATGIACGASRSGTFHSDLTNLIIDDASRVTIQNNNATPYNETYNKKDRIGGGLRIEAGSTVVLGRNTVINNNSADKAGADIFIEPGCTLTFSAGNAGIGDILQDCGDGIDGWYIDAEGQRWNFHGDPSVAQKLLDSKDAALEYNGDGTYTITAGSEGLALKAAHAELPAPTPDPDRPDTPTPNPDPKPEPKPGPDTSITPEDPQLPPVQDARADTPDSPVLPSSPTNPAVQDAHALPQTGTSLFAALAMALSGFALTIAGAWASLLGKNSRH